MTPDRSVFDLPELRLAAASKCSRLTHEDPGGDSLTAEASNPAPDHKQEAEAGFPADWDPDHIAAKIDIEQLEKDAVNFFGCRYGGQWIEGEVPTRTWSSL